MSVFGRLIDLFSDEEDPDEPVYDPVHLGGTVVVSLVAAGCLYWLLWTLLVFEGGLFLKLRAAATVIFTGKTLADLGYRGSYDMGAFEGWFGNCAALVIAAAVLAVLHRLYLDAASRR